MTDDTIKTLNFRELYEKTLPPEGPNIFDDSNNRCTCKAPEIDISRNGSGELSRNSLSSCVIINGKMRTCGNVSTNQRPIAHLFGCWEIDGNEFKKSRDKGMSRVYSHDKAKMHPQKG